MIVKHSLKTLMNHSAISLEFLFVSLWCDRTEHNCLDFNPICPGWGWGWGQTWNLHPTQPLNIKGQKDSYLILPSSVALGLQLGMLDPKRNQSALP